MNSNTYRLLIAIGLFTVAQSSSAQEDLMNVYQRALQNDPVIREAEAIYLATLVSPPNKKP